ncbi:MAG TPA: hypothetical protein DEB39_07420 [Planctomycetaceae bacterium]|nr:hypothetical protein [Planctomycetaceae bacterium]
MSKLLYLFEPIIAHQNRKNFSISPHAYQLPYPWGRRMRPIPLRYGTGFSKKQKNTQIISSLFVRTGRITLSVVFEFSQISSTRQPNLSHFYRKFTRQTYSEKKTAEDTSSPAVP